VGFLYLRERGVNRTAQNLQLTVSVHLHRSLVLGATKENAITTTTITTTTITTTKTIIKTITTTPANTTNITTIIKTITTTKSDM
jgi:hypothetical protein